MKYKGFTIEFYEYVPRIFSYNKRINMSLSLGLTDIQKTAYDKMYGKDSWKTILTKSMKQLIDDYEQGRTANR